MDVCAEGILGQKDNSMKTYVVTSGSLRGRVVRVRGKHVAAFLKAVRLYKPDALGELAKVTELNCEPVYFATRDILKRYGLSL
jgi:hypothetical protein